MEYPVISDSRYFVVRGRLWRMADPLLGDSEKHEMTRRLIAARRAVRDAKHSDNPEAEAAAHQAVDAG